MKEFVSWKLVLNTYCYTVVSICMKAVGRPQTIKHTVSEIENVYRQYLKNVEHI